MYFAAVRIACPLPRFFSCFNTTTSISESRDAMSASVLPSSTTRTFFKTEQHAAATSLTVLLLLKTGTAHQIWFNVIELFCSMPPFPCGVFPRDEQIPQCARISQFMENPQTIVCSIRREYAVSYF